MKDIVRKFAESKQLPWLKLEGEKVIMIVDNHLLSTYRACPSYFFMQHIEGWRMKAFDKTPKDRQWFLDFGITFHKLMEYYYKNFKKPSFDKNTWAMDMSKEVWDKMKMDEYKEHPEYQLIMGWKGFSLLLFQYAMRFSAENERLHVLGTEIAFGKNREVLLFKSEDLEIYLAGRMDAIVDDGFYIMPLDHKTMKMFKRDPAELYHIDEGPTGYIYALRSVLPSYCPTDHILKRDCNRILINAISKAVPAKDPMDRFRRICIWKTSTQLESYKERMISTCDSILADIERYAKGKSVKRDTSHCTNWFHGKCVYYDVHTQADTFGEQATLKNGFVQLPIWDTENISLNGA